VTRENERILRNWAEPEVSNVRLCQMDHTKSTGGIHSPGHRRTLYPRQRHSAVVGVAVVDSASGSWG
jgi:hypothetical protein